MKEIKAFIRKHRIADVLQALRDSGLCDLGSAGTGCHNVTISEVLRPFAGADASQQRYSMDLAEPVIAEYRLELVCSGEAVSTLTETIAQAAHTGQPEGGWIFVSEIEHMRGIP